MLREATSAEFRQLFGGSPPEIWDGWVAHDDGGKAVAAGSICWLWEGAPPRAWLQLVAGPAASLPAVHRLARRMLDYVMAIGEDAAWAYSDPRRPEQQRYLRRLGFIPDPAVRGPFDHPVWRKDLRCAPLN